MPDKSRRQVIAGLAFLVTTIIFGTVGYMFLEGWTLLESLYMTVISVTTTGFKEVHDLTNSGRLLTLFVIIMGMGSIAYTGGRAIQLLFENQVFRRRRMSKKLEDLEHHFIVCGYGRMGKYICDELEERNAPFVIIEKDVTKLDIIHSRRYLFVHGDATSDDILQKTGIEKAKGLVAVLGSDADNVFTTLSAKALNSKLFIVARAVEEETESKLMKAGASRVVKPYETAGTKMAELLLRPGVIEFIDIVARDKTVDLNIEELIVSEHSPLVNKSLADSNIRQELNIMIVSIIKPDGRLMYNPQSLAIIEPADRLIALGERLSLQRLNELCSDGKWAIVT